VSQCGDGAAAAEAGSNPRECGPGHEDHFDVTVYRNVAACGGVPFERIPIGQLMSEQQQQVGTGVGGDGGRGWMGQNEQGRVRILNDWLLGLEGESPLRAQRSTMALLGHLYGLMDDASDAEGATPTTLQ
jgi:hypothetical protein